MNGVPCLHLSQPFVLFFLLSPDVACRVSLGVTVFLNQFVDVSLLLIRQQLCSDTSVVVFIFGNHCLNFRCGVQFVFYPKKWNAKILTSLLFFFLLNHKILCISNSPSLLGGRFQISLRNFCGLRKIRPVIDARIFHHHIASTEARQLHILQYIPVPVQLCSQCM